MFLGPVRRLPVREVCPSGGAGPSPSFPLCAHTCGRGLSPATARSISAGRGRRLAILALGRASSLRPFTETRTALAPPLPRPVPFPLYPKTIR